MVLIEEDGIWFLPTNPDKAIAGKLTFSYDQDPKLFLLGVLQEVEFEDIIPSQTEFGIINGILVSGKEVTLCYCVQPLSIKTGIQTSEIYARYLIIGHHFASVEELLFKGASVRYDNLEEWVGLSNIEISWSINKDRRQVREINIKQTTQEVVELGKFINFTLSLYDTPIEQDRLQMASFLGVSAKRVALEEKKSIIFHSDIKHHLEDIKDAILKFQDLLVFASGQTTYPYNILSGIVIKKKELRLPENIELKILTGLFKPEKTAKSELGFEIHRHGDEIKALEEDVERLISVQIYFRSQATSSSGKDFDRGKMLFGFRDVSDSFAKVLTAWEISFQELKPIIDIYLRLIYIPIRHINDYFLSLAQALEAFHSLAHEGIHLDKKVFKSVIRRTLEQAIDSSIPDSIPKEGTDEVIDLKSYKKILKEEKIAHLNNYSLRERLDEIMTEYESWIPDGIIHSEEFRVDFLKRVRKTRNYLTHLSSEKDDYVASGQELIVICRILMIVLNACLLRQLGLDELKVKSILSEK